MTNHHRICRGDACVARAVRAACVAVLIAALGCSLNPATGERQFVIISEQQEIAMGREADVGIQQQMGLYPDEDLQHYVQELGGELAAGSEKPDLPWTFRVLDDPIVNAFALPGGYIYVTRGILTHFNSEAELASVLGHEIGHVTGRHGAERMSTAQIATLGLGVAAIASEDFRPYAGLASQGLGLLFLKFGRDDERQADELGLRYMTRGNYDPNEMPRVFETLGRVSAAHGGGRIPAWLSTHPDPGNRAARIAEQTRALPPEQQQGKINRDSYLARLEGMPFGQNPREGYVIGSAFYHPDLAFQLTFPEGWKVVNQRQTVGGISPDQDALVVLTLAEEGDADEGFQKFFSQEGLERGQSWRRSFYYFRTVPPETQQQQQQQKLQGLVGFVSHGGQLFRLLSYTSDDKWPGYGRPLQQSLASFKRLTDRRYLDVEPKRVRLVKIDRAMTLEEFNRRYPSTVDLAELAIVNGVGEGARFEAGRNVKRIVGGKLPTS
ncbi:MAG: M48 family metalloprotease [Thermoanaerobaculia bacterium]